MHAAALSRLQPYSFRDLQEVSFVASSLKERKGYLIDCAAAPNDAVVPAAVVYGANASGKSNLVDAMQTMRAMVLNSHTRGDPGGGVLREPFRLDPACLQAVTQFDIDFVTERTRYHYGFRHPTRPLFRNGWMSTRRLTVDSGLRATVASSTSDAG